MFINITVPEYSECIPLNLDASVSLNMYSWVDIVSCNIVNNPELIVKVICLECDGKELDCTQSLLALGIQESSCISVKITTQTYQDYYNQTNQIAIPE